MEIWKDIINYEDYYEVSNLGQIRSKKRLVRLGNKYSYLKLRIRKLTIDRLGYLYVNLSKEGKVKKYKVHRLVAEAFIPNPQNKLFINHKNANKKDNNFENLEWVTASENVLDAFKNGLIKNHHGESHSKILKNNDILEIRDKYKSGEYSQSCLAAMYNTTQTNIGFIVRRETWTHI